MNHQDNFQPVRKILICLRDGLGSFVLEQYKRRYSGKDYLDRLQQALGLQHPFEDEEQARQDVDLQGWLTAIQSQWDEVFRKKLGHTAPKARSNSNVANARNFLYEIQNARNSFQAHETAGTAITNHDVYSLADTATRLLQVVRATEEATITEEIKLEYGRRLYGVQANEYEPASDEVIPDESEDQSEEPESSDPGAQVGAEESGRQVDLSGLNLSGMDLRGRNLHLANLQGACLSGSILESCVDSDLSNVNLSRAELSEGNFTGSNFSHANLSEARLGWANLKNCNMTHAKLVNADLHMARIDGADFSNADLTGVDMHNPKEYYLDNGRRVEIESMLDASGEYGADYELFDYLFLTIGPSDVNFSGAILRGANMQRAWLEMKITLTRAEMTEANFFGSRIAANLAGAILSRANLSKCHILSSDFSGAKMDGIDLSESECVYTKFANAQMSGAKLHNFMIGDHDSGTDDSWDNVNLSEANLSGASLTPHQSFRNANLTGAIFNGSQLSFANFSNADLKETDFTGADLTCADFTTARFYPYSTILPDGSYWDEDTDMTRFTGPLEDC